jgi:hypothetical protein
VRDLSPGCHAASFDGSDITWLDFEAASRRDLKAAGTFRYASDTSTSAIVLAYAVGNEPARPWHADGAILNWDCAPSHLRGAFARLPKVRAWNAGFDSAIWNYSTHNFPFLPPERVIDVMVQAAVSNLPTDLESASRYLGGEGKRKDGKKLIKLFCVEGANPSEYPEEWQRFLAYACQDVEAMRDVYRRTRPLPLEEWQQYWAFEHINRRGVMLDMPFVLQAEALAAEDGVAINHRLRELTNGVVSTVGQAKRIATWLHDQVVLALGFGGSVKALLNMALNYRIHLEPSEACRIVDAWREANPWAREFWGAHRDGESFGLWGAAMSAWETPGLITTAGRIAFTYREDYLGGALFMALPSGRLLTYPRPRWRDVDVLDKDGHPIGEKRTELSFRRAHGRAKLWHGTFAENATQATAADILRHIATRIETNPALSWMKIRMTTHDEIVVECDEARADEAKAILRGEMLTVPDWATGLPLQSEEQTCHYYTKAKAALKEDER